MADRGHELKHEARSVAPNYRRGPIMWVYGPLSEDAIDGLPLPG